MKKFPVLLIIFFLLSPLYSQHNLNLANQVRLTNSTGLPFITNYTTKEYGGHVQNWCFMQDLKGVMYIGNGSGLLEFDGSSWRLIETSNKSFVRSLAMDDSGRIYVGASGDFGYLEPDNRGQMQYVSLLDKIQEKDKVFSYVWTTHVTSDGVYFQTRERLFRFSRMVNDTNGRENWKVKVWTSAGSFNYAFWVNGDYYVQQGGVGLMKMVRDSLVLLPGAAQFANDRLQIMLPFANASVSNTSPKFLIGTFNRGLFIYDGSSFRPFKTDADAFLGSSTVYDGVALSDGTFGFATLDGGFIIIDHQGHVLQHLDMSNGLPGNSVLSVYVDREGTIWLGPENGISHVEIPSPLSRYDAASGLIGTSYAVVRHKGLLYVATTNGVFYLDTDASRFKPVSGFRRGNLQTFSLLSVGDYLLSAVGTGLYQIQGTEATLIKPSVGLSFVPLVLHRSLLDSNHVFVGLFDGLVSFRMDRNNAGKWIEEGKIEGVREYIIRITEQKPGVIWLSTNDHGTLRLTFSRGSLRNPQVERFGREQALPSDGGLSVYQVAGRTVFAMKDGVFRFDEEKKLFFPDSLFDVVSFGGTQDEYSMVEDYEGNIWLNFGRETAVLRLQPDGHYRTDKIVLQRFADQPSVNIYPEKNGVIWFATNQGLIRYDPSVKKDYSVEYPALIRKVLVTGDSVIYGGTGKQNYLSGLNYNHNAIRFEFSATTYDNPKETRYQSILEGFDKKWSGWTKENKRDYTNLGPGVYHFRVRAKNIFESISREATYSFRILPPWYRTWWAYGGYAFIIGIGIFITDRFQRRRLIKRERDRSQLREAELRAQTAEAQAKALQVENERKKNIELLSEIGQEITSSLSIGYIIDTCYGCINDLLDASVFGIGLYNKETESLDFPATKERGQTLPSYSKPLDNENYLAVWCFKNQKEILINDYRKEYRKYITEDQPSSAGDETESILYLPLTYKENRIGVITAQSFAKDAYSEYHLSILQNMATYTAIALDNAEAYRQLNRTVEQLNDTLNKLKSTQEQLIVQEKLASLGQLTAGIAHEIKNPLNFINNFAEISAELVDELLEEIKVNSKKSVGKFAEEVADILHDLQQNSRKINQHGKRADSIVYSMLQHSRGRSGERHDTDINALLEENLNLAYHGMRARDAFFNVTMKKELDDSLSKISVVPQDISRVFLNIINNGFYEANKKRNKVKGDFEPQLTVKSINHNGGLEVRIRDNGNGIPPEVRDKLFSPFFTTKPTGEGTGLGLSLSYDIVVNKHQGDIRFETKEGEFTEFIITLPKNQERHG